MLNKYDLKQMQEAIVDPIGKRIDELAEMVNALRADLAAKHSKRKPAAKKPIQNIAPIVELEYEDENDPKP